MVLVISAQSEAPSTAFGWCIQLGTLSNALTQPYRPRWSCCAGATDKNLTCHIWLKQSLVDPIASSPRLLIRFPSSTAACRISWSNAATWPHRPARAHYLTCFLCGGVKQSVKLREKHYTCLLEQAGGRATDRLKRNGSQEGQSQDSTHIRGQIQITLEKIKSAINLEVSETLEDCASDAP